MHDYYRLLAMLNDVRNILYDASRSTQDRIHLLLEIAYPFIHKTSTNLYHRFSKATFAKAINIYTFKNNMQTFHSEEQRKSILITWIRICKDIKLKE